MELLTEKTNSFTIKGVTEDTYNNEFDKAYAALKRDNPLFGYQGNIFDKEWIDDVLYVSKADKKNYIDDTLFMHSDYVWEKVLENARCMIETIPYSNDAFTRLTDLVSIVTDNIIYDYEGAYYIDYPQSITIYNLIGFFYYRECVCDGYGDGIKYLCDALGIPCIIVRGSLNGEAHEWNYIRLEDGKWYSLDLSGVYLKDIDPTAVLMNREEMISRTNHLPEDMIGVSEFVIPEVSEDKYDQSSIKYHRLEKTKVDFDTYDNEAPKFIYEVNEDGNTCIIVGYQGEQIGDLIIPDSIDGFIVTKIGAKAFYYNNGFSGGIYIPDSVTEIGLGAFLKCKNAKGLLHLSNNLKSIDDFAFAFCDNLSGEIEFPDNLKSIGECAFAYDESITGSIMLPKDLEILGSGAFTNCKGLTGTYYIPDAVEYNNTQISWTNISNLAVSDTNTRYKTFDGVLYSKDGTILLCCAPGKTDVLRAAESTVEIAEKACYDGKITGLILNNSLKKIGDKAFSYCYDMEILDIGEELEEVGEMAFHYAGYHKGKFDCDLNISNIKKLGDSAFNRCKFTGHLYLSDYLTEIPNGAFCGSSFTGDLIIPDSITKIGPYAFYGDYTGSEGLLNIFDNKEKLVLSKNIIEIGENAFNHAGLSGSLVLTGVNVGESAFEDNFFESIIE